MGFNACFDRALSDHADNHDDRAVAIFFEDDARLFESDFCDPAYRQRLFSATPGDAFLIMLGGHRWAPGASEAYNATAHFQEVTASFGAYAFAVPVGNLGKLRAGFARLLKRKRVQKRSPRTEIGTARRGWQGSVSTR